MTYYDQVADAPDAVARLRRFILDLAVRGKLVPQDKSEESSFQFLTNRQAIDKIQHPFEIPNSWIWVNVGSVAESRLGKMLDKNKNKGSLRFYLRNINVRWFDFDLSNLLQMRFENSEIPEYELHDGDVLICEGGEPGRAAVWDCRESHVYFQKAIHRVRFLPTVNSSYFVRALRASAEDGRLADYLTGSGIKHFTGKELQRYLFPLPPLAEQHRIVAKVNELMSLCDKLEVARAGREATRDQFAAASLARLTTPEAHALRPTALAPNPLQNTPRRIATLVPTSASLREAGNSFAADARFFLEALPALTTRPNQINALRQTILNLAITGRLTAHWRDQNPHDGEAAQIVGELDEAHRINGGHRRGNAAFATEGAHDLEFEQLPSSWSLTDLKSAVRPDRPITYGILMPGPDTPEGVPYVRVADFPGDQLNLHSIKRAAREIEQKYARARLSLNDILLSIRGTVGRTCLVPVELNGANITQDTARISLQENLDRNFILMVLRAPSTQVRMKNCSKGVAVRGINIGDVRAIQLPVPPLAEQRQIVAKVNELMTLCDKLEASLTTAADTRRRLLDALLAEALAPDEDRLLEAAE
nr:restriction endonuclease subunit S [Methylobacterium aquaticum]